MPEKVTVVYAFENGFRKEIEATDVEQATDIARGIYEEIYDCDYAAVLVGGEVVKEWGW